MNWILWLTDPQSCYVKQCVVPEWTRYRCKIPKLKLEITSLKSLFKQDLHTPTLSADFWSSPSKIKQNLTSMQCLPRFWKIFELFTEFDPILAWILLGNFEKFVSADKTGVCKSGLRPMFTFTRNEWKLFTVFTTTSVDWKKKRSNSIGQMWRNGWKSWACFNFFARDFRGGLTFSISKDG